MLPHMLRVAMTAVLLGLLAGCGGSTKDAADPKKAAADQGLTAGQKCLEDAAAKREPRKDAPDKIHVAHVLVRHQDLERPEGATRTREQACLRALEARSALEKGQEWEAVVGKYSDAPGATAGDLGEVTRDELAPPFADAAFALEPNELSYVVESERGFHIIVRLE